MSKVFRIPPKEGDRLISRYGVKFEKTDNGLEQPVVICLDLAEDGSAVWNEVTRSLAQSFTEQEKTTVAEAILATFVRKSASQKRSGPVIGDKVYHYKVKVSGTLRGYQKQKDGTEMAVVEVNGATLLLTKKGLVKDRNR